MSMYNPFPKFVIRTPLFSFNYLKEELFEKAILNQQFKEAIYIASTVLYNELHKYINDKISDKSERQSIEYSLYKYLGRMSTRCTPFGLFAGCSVGKICDNRTNVVLEDSMNRHTRLDMYYLCMLSQELSKIAEIKNSVKYFPNTTIYLVGNKYRYIEYEYSKYGRKHKISAVEQSSYLKKILKIAAKGATITELAEYFINQGISKDDVFNFINEIIDSQIIVSELSPHVTGDDFLSKIVSILKKLSVGQVVSDKLNEIKTLLNRIDENKNDSIALYELVKEKIREVNIPFEEKYIFQSDMAKIAVEANIGQEVMKEVKSAMRFLNRITPNNRNENLMKFIQSFRERYEDREVSLMEVLDPEMGIGYPVNVESIVESPLINDFAVPHLISNNFNFQIDDFLTVLHKKTVEALSLNKLEIEFTDEDIKGAKENWNDLPATISCMFNVLKSDQNEARILLSSFYGSSGAKLLARFSHTNIEIEKLVKDIALKEQEMRPDVIFAEIAHLPDSRIGNILSRPHIRDFEILYLANSDIAENKVIRMSDLTISIKNGRICLRSKKINKEIVPRLTNAHNYNINPMPVYKFLCDIQIQGGRDGLFFHWGGIGRIFDFRPRVRYNNVVLSLASWTIRISDMKYLFSVGEDTLIEEVTKWREKQNIPKYVLLEEGDNKLFVDFEKQISIQTFFSIIKKRNSFQLSEFLFDKDSVMVRDINGNPYLNECIIAFYKDKET